MLARSIVVAVDRGFQVVADQLGDATEMLEGPDVSVRWLGLYGDTDQTIPVADVERLRTAAASSGEVTEVVRYP